VVQLPELAKIPPLDLPAACAKVAVHNERARNLNASSFGHEGEYLHTVYAAAEAGCSGGERDYPFYDELGEVLAFGESRGDADQLIAATREALRRAPSAQQAALQLRGLNRRLHPIADQLAPELYLIGAEAMEAHLNYCTGEDAAACRVHSHWARGENLAAAGRWRADAGSLRAGIAAYREALRDVPDQSKGWIELHTLIGSALAQLSENVDQRGSATLLLQALQEYVLATRAVGPSAQATWAMINQNVCSIREPYAAISKDRAGIQLAIEECEKAGAYYREQGEKSNEAAAHHNMARGYARL